MPNHSYQRRKFEAKALSEMKSYGYHVTKSGASKIPDLIGLPTAELKDPFNRTNKVLVVEVCAKSALASHRRDMKNLKLSGTKIRQEIWSYKPVKAASGKVVSFDRTRELVKNADAQQLFKEKNPIH